MNKFNYLRWFLQILKSLLDMSVKNSGGDRGHLVKQRLP